MAYEFDKKKESEEKNTAKDSGERSAAGAWLPNSLVTMSISAAAASSLPSLPMNWSIPSSRER